MAGYKSGKTIKPLFGLKHDFYDSLDHTLQMALNLMQTVNQAISLGAVKNGPVKEMLTERSEAMRLALMRDEP